MVDPHTLLQHLVCIAASENRIRTSLWADELPEGTTPDQARVEIMTELEESVQEIGRSSPVPFDWNLSFYTFPKPASDEMAPVGGGGPGEANGAGAGGMIAPSAGDVREVAPALPMPLPVPSPQLELTVQVREFVAFALPLTAAMPVSMGRILETRWDEDGTELRCHWYVPKKVIDGAPREEYGKGGWAKEFVSVNGKLVPATGWEDIASASAAFKSPTKGGDKLPRHVWKAIAESVTEGEEEEGDLIS